MSVAKLQDDPRDAALETKFTLPNSWYKDSGMCCIVRTGAAN